MLGINAKRMLETLKEERVASLEDALQLTGEKFVVRDVLSDVVCVDKGPSNFHTNALRVSYISPDYYGIGVELVFNQELEYRKVIVKCSESVSGYIPFGADRKGNLLQIREVNNCDWQGALRDVGDLTKLR